MNVKNVEKENGSAKVTVEIAKDEFQTALDKAYAKIRKDIMIPGFRKGHAPRMVIEAAYGKHVFFEDAVEDMFPDIYKDAVLTQDIRPVGRPSVSKMDIADDGAVTLTIVTDLYPVAELGEYKNLEIEKAEVEVKESEVEAELDRMAQNVARITTVDRPAQEGDTAVIDFEGFENGKAFAGGKGENYELKLGSHTFIPGFEEQVAGMSAGEEKDIEVTFPADYHAEELAGKPVVFKVKVHEVKEKEVPEMDDEFAKDVSEFDTLADFKKDLGEKLKERRETQNQRDFEAALMEQVMDNMEVEIPDAMVEYEADNLVNDMAQRIQAQGIPFDQYLAMTGMTMDIMREQAKAAALERVRRELALGAIVAAENITISDEELEEEYKRLAEQYHMEVDKVKAAVTADSIRKEQSYHKAEHVVYDSAKVGKAPAKKKSTKKKAEESAEGEEKPKKAPAKKAAKKEQKEAE